MSEALAALQTLTEDLTKLKLKPPVVPSAKASVYIIASIPFASY